MADLSQTRAPDAADLDLVGLENEPERVTPKASRILAAERRKGEILIGWVQLAIVGLAAALYAISPQAFASMTRFEPVPLVLAAFVALTVSRLVLAYRYEPVRAVVALGIVLDFVLLYGLIWSYHLQYDQPPGFSLKAPTLFYAFVFIALRGLSFEPFNILFAGAVAALGWLALTLAALAHPDAVVTRSFVEHLTSNAILIGAEIDRIVSILIATAVLALVIEKSRRHLVTAAVGQTATGELSRFFSPEVVDRIVESEEQIGVGQGELKQAAIVMIDIRGFTALTAAVSPRAVVTLLSDYERRMGRVIREHGGSIDKFLGDGILATFGCVGESRTPEADALRAALGCAQESRAWALQRRARGEVPVGIGVAVTSGSVVFGTVGDGVRLEFTSIGEPVNRAAKLEKHTKVRDTAVITDWVTLQAAVAQGFERGDAFRMHPAEPVSGLADPLDIAVLDLPSPG